MLTPRDNFKKSELAKGWLNIMDSTQFQAGATAALLEMQLALAHPQDMGTAAAYQWQMQGAKRFLETLMGLTEPQLAAKLPARQNLEHRI